MDSKRELGAKVGIGEWEYKMRTSNSVITVDLPDQQIKLGAMHRRSFNGWS